MRRRPLEGAHAIVRVAWPCVVVMGLSALVPASAQETVLNGTGRAVGLEQTSQPVVPPLGGSTRRFEEVRRIHAPEARQGVAVSATHFYAIGNTRLVKRARDTGEPVAEWTGAPERPLVHLNSCVVLGGDLVCAHSNFPGVPMVSSIETFDAATLEHRHSHSFGIHEGSLTWATPRARDWWLHFAQYGGAGGLPDRGPEWSTLVRFTEGWRRAAGYVYPPALVAALAPYSASGGNWGPDGLLYVTGHDAPALYVLRLPAMGSVLEWVETISAPIQGQAWAFDPIDPASIWGISRATGEIVVARLRE